MVSKVISIIGGGAAGCFCAVQIKRRCPDAKVIVYEAQSKLMSKLAVTGGGRCNITNTFEGVGSLKEVYPRGDRLIKAAFHHLSPSETIWWWENEGVKLVAQEDGCVFPKSQDAMQVVRKLEELMRESGVEIMCSHRVEAINRMEDSTFELRFNGKVSQYADIVVLTSGGGALSMLNTLNGIALEPTAPSLFTFKIKDESFTSLMGTVVDNATLSFSGTKFRSRGTLLITDWGVSGPATLKLSSYAAYYLKDSAYKATLLINYLSLSETEIRALISETCEHNAQRMMANAPLPGLTSRMWGFLMSRAGLRSDIRWAELGSKGLNRLVNTLIADPYQVDGRCRFKDEFVTAGGVSATEVNPNTLESKHFPGLYFAGEVLDIDAITGGFNLQTAWSTAFAVARAIGK